MSDLHTLPNCIPNCFARSRAGFGNRFPPGRSGRTSEGTEAAIPLLLNAGSLSPIADVDSFAKHTYEEIRYLEGATRWWESATARNLKPSLYKGLWDCQVEDPEKRGLELVDGLYIVV